MDIYDKIKQYGLYADPSFELIMINDMICRLQRLLKSNEESLTIEDFTTISKEINRLKSMRSEDYKSDVIIYDERIKRQNASPSMNYHPVLKDNFNQYFNFFKHDEKQCTNRNY